MSLRRHILVIFLFSCFFASCTKNCGFKNNSGDNFTEVYGEATLVNGEAIVVGLQRRASVFNKILNNIFVAFAGATPAFTSQICGKGEVSKGVYSVSLTCPVADFEFVVTLESEDGKDIQMAIVDKMNPGETNVSHESTAVALFSLNEFSLSPDISMKTAFEKAHIRNHKLKQSGTNLDFLQLTGETIRSQEFVLLSAQIEKLSTHKDFITRMSRSLISIDFKKSDEQSNETNLNIALENDTNLQSQAVQVHFYLDENNQIAAEGVIKLDTYFQEIQGYLTDGNSKKLADILLSSGVGQNEFKFSIDHATLAKAEPTSNVSVDLFKSVHKPTQITLKLKNVKNEEITFKKKEQAERLKFYVPVCGFEKISFSEGSIADGIQDCEKFSSNATQDGNIKDPNWKLAGLVWNESGSGLYQIWANSEVENVDQENIIHENNHQYILLSDYVVGNVKNGVNFCQANGIMDPESHPLSFDSSLNKFVYPTNNLNYSLNILFKNKEPSSEQVFNFLNLLRNENDGCATTRNDSDWKKGYAAKPVSLCEDVHENKWAKGWPLLQNVKWNLPRYSKTLEALENWSKKSIPSGRQGLLSDPNSTFWSATINSEPSNSGIILHGQKNDSSIDTLYSMIGASRLVRCVSVSLEH